MFPVSNEAMNNTVIASVVLSNFVETMLNNIVGHSL